MPGVLKVQGVGFPELGLGTWQLHGTTCREAVRHALELGYRHVDTARLYRNETQVGAGIRDSGVDRDEVFVATKIPGRSADRAGVRRGVEASLSELGTDRIDLLLLHQPSPHVPLAETMAAFREQQDAGRVLHLGVSNFSADALEAALEEAPILTVQNEYHPGRDHGGVLDVCRERDVAFTAYSPLAQGDLVEHEVLTEIGERHGKSAAQVAIRWLLDQEAVVTIPRSSDAEHRAENLDVDDFSLSEDDRRRIAALR